VLFTTVDIPTVHISKHLSDLEEAAVAIPSQRMRVSWDQTEAVK